MTIERLPTLEIRPEWEDPKGDRYQAIPLMRIAFIQVMSDPDHIFVVADQALPRSIPEAVEMVTNWKVAYDAAED